ncbi:hypothetical protein GF373_05545 [bacterium]|nr:hypothetical protein [bacterium]
MEKIEAWLGDKPWDVIHFNWGLHDVKIMEDGKHQVALKQYKKNFHKLVTRLTKTGARLIWCSTTPVPQVPIEKMRPPRRWQDVIRYNAAAKEIADKSKIPINDLYSFALPRLDKIQRKNNVHFTKEGSKMLAAQVVREIKKVLMH